MTNITRVHGRQILDSRGNPTVEAEVTLDNGMMARASVPSGASTGTHEAIELRDNDPKKFGGKGVLQAVKNVNEEIAQRVQGLAVADQETIDNVMIKCDGTSNKGRLGANAILAVSLACAKAAALTKNKPFYSYLHDLSGSKQDVTLPMPLMNIINGGQHAAGSTDIQEFMIVPVSAPTFSEAIRMGAETFHALGKVLKSAGYATTVGDEGGYAPSVHNGNKEALDLISQAVAEAGYTLGKDMVFALDIAASELFKDGQYVLATENKKLTPTEMIKWLVDLQKNYPIVSIEDGLAEDDWAGWQELTLAIGQATQLVGDDLLVTNTKFLERGIQEKAANAILIKFNQIGTVTETIAAVNLAHANNWKTIISHRSGETEDTSIAHLAVGLACGQIKTGSLSRTERVAKYNEIIRIEEELGDKAVFAGATVFS